MDGSDFKYRYKGKFVSASKAASLANLKNASKFLTSENYWKGKQETIRKGYWPSIEKTVKKALEHPPLPHKPITPQQQARIEKSRTEKKHEREHLKDVAEKIIRRAEREDIDFEEAADEYFEPDDFRHFTYEDLMQMTEEVFERGEEFFDFDMEDLEDDSPRIS